MRKVLFTSSDRKIVPRGSWQIRGEQIATLMPAAVAQIDPPWKSISDYDLVVVVKKASEILERNIKAVRRPVVFDVLDGWPQPIGNGWKKADLVQFIRSRIAKWRPIGVVFPTQAMMADVGLGDWAATVIPHHGRPGAALNPIRHSVSTIGYEGSERYLEEWEAEIRGQCRDRGWTFVINPKELAEVDIILSVRGEKWRGYATANWKSGVKMANAQATGTPIISLREAGALETQGEVGPRWIDDMWGLEEALDDLTPRAARLAASAALRSRAVTLDSVVAQYRRWLDEI